jgi:hypothetical protein
VIIAKTKQNALNQTGCGRRRREAMAAVSKSSHPLTESSH